MTPGNTPGSEANPYDPRTSARSALTGAPFAMADSLEGWEGPAAGYDEPPPVTTSPTRTTPNGWRDRLAVIKLEDVEVEDVEWFWPGRIPFGKVTVIDGDPGLGKSTLTIDLAARLSTGAPLPTGEYLHCGPASTVMLSAEDGAADTIKPRMMAAGGDQSRIRLLDHVVDAEDGKPRPFEIPTDLDVLEALVAELGARLVVIDPFVAFLAGAVKANHDQDVRRAMHPMAGFAQRTGAAVILVRHLNKQDGTNAIHRGGGSIGIIGAARAGLLVAPTKEDPELIAVATVKNNLAKKGPTLGYRLVNDERYSVARVDWQGALEVSASDLLMRDDPETPERNEARDFLLTHLGRGPAKWDVLSRLAKDEDGPSEATLRRVRQSMKAQGAIDKRQNGRAGEPGNYWEWFLTGEQDAVE